MPSQKFQAGIQDINQVFKERDAQEKAKALELPYVNLTQVPLNPDLSKLLSKEDSDRAHLVLFFRLGRRLKAATLDPEDPETKKALEALKEKGFEVSISIVSEESLKAGQRIYFSDIYEHGKVVQPTHETDLGSFEKELMSLEQLRDKIENSSYDVGLGLVERGAYRTHASDIHFEPRENDVLVRFRIDGVLNPVFALTPKIYEGLTKEIKYKSKLTMNVSDLPQDGDYTFEVNEKPISVRVSTIPTRFGEAIVMRVLDVTRTFRPFEELGFEGEALRQMEESIKLPHGMILVTGPTGSGKTTTLYSMLRSIDTKAKKVITLEDPIEYNLEGIIQSQVNADEGYTFATGLRAILRQDPNIIMVGEIRDLETAETAAQASLTGHLVISTLHTNSALESIPRLVNMGLKPFILAPAIDLIIAQRLVRLLCLHCAQSQAITSEEKSQLETVLNRMKARGMEVPVMPSELKKPVGCDLCSKTGYSGQIAIAEVLRFDAGLRNLILDGKSLSDMESYAEKNSPMRTILEDGTLKVIRGITTLDEVYRVAI